MRLLAVLDADIETLSAEAARAEADGAGAVEFVDLRTWRAMRRLADSGLLQFTGEAQELYRSPAMLAEAPAARDHHRQGAKAIAEADRALRMAQTLSDGGFPKEASPLLAKSLHAMAAALMTTRGEKSSGAPVAGGDIRRLVDCGALPAEALALLSATQAGSCAATIADVSPLLSSTNRILMAIVRNEPSLTVRPGESGE
jgi:hypothetical protein